MNGGNDFSETKKHFASYEASKLSCTDSGPPLPNILDLYANSIHLYTAEILYVWWATSEKEDDFSSSIHDVKSVKVVDKLVWKNGLQAHVRHTNGQEGPNRFLGVKAGEDEHLHQARETLVSWISIRCGQLHLQELQLAVSKMFAVTKVAKKAGRQLMLLLVNSAFSF